MGAEDSICWVAVAGDDFSPSRLSSWEPRTSFEEMVRLMVDSDLELLASGVPQKRAG
jgi:hypothetical protein